MNQKDENHKSEEWFGPMQRWFSSFDREPEIRKQSRSKVISLTGRSSSFSSPYNVLTLKSQVTAFVRGSGLDRVSLPVFNRVCLFCVLDLNERVSCDLAGRWQRSM